MASSPVRRILVFRALQLGDLLCAVPAFRALRASYPEAEITLMGLPWAADFVRRFPRYLDRFIEFPGFPSLPERAVTLGQWPEFLRDVQSERFDLSIQMHGDGSTTNPVVGLFGARENAGFAPSSKEASPNFLPYPADEPEVWRCLRLVRHIGASLHGEYLEFEVLRSDFSRLHALPETQQVLHHDYACLHPGARADWRRWPTDSYAKVARRLAGQGIGVVLTGSESEMPLVDEVAEKSGVNCLRLAGKTDLGMLAALLSGSRFLVCNDTGVSHLAAALRIKSIVIFNRSEANGWPPLDRQRHRVLTSISGVTPDLVLEHANDLLEREAA